MRTVVLEGETDLDGFRRAARVLWAHGKPPEQVQWQVATAPAGLWHAEDAPEAIAPQAAPVRVPPWFAELCEEVVLHREPQRFALLYRLLWRLGHEPGLRDDPLDADRVRAAALAKAVARDMHKMRAFVRFRPVTDPHGRTVHVAWFEPAHRIVAANAPWFARRFANMAWAILTPDASAAWDGAQLTLGPGADARDAPPADAGEALWLTYYQSIFNPARLKLKSMQQHMPRKYWHNLPEARLIAPLAAAAQERTGMMIDQPPSSPNRKAAPVPVRADTLGVPIASLADLKAATDRCRQCPIGEHATQSVAGEGPIKAPLMFVGEQPGDQEDLRGRPFVGPAGQLFDRALAAVGLDRGQVLVTNAVRHFKFELRGKRRIHKTPTQREAAACLHWLEQEIALVEPGALVALGATAARSLLGRPVAVTAERGRWLTRPDGREVLVTLHPSALLRMPPDVQEAAFDAFVADLRLAASAAAAQRASTGLTP